MELMVESWVAVAIIGATIAVVATRRFLAWGSLMVANVAIFLLTEFGRVRQGILGAAEPIQQAAPFSAIHGELALHIPQVVDLTAHGALTVVTHMFVHADFFHLLGNMLILFAFGMPFEERIGHRRFLAIYLLTGLAAAAAQTVMSLGSLDLLMGASGAVFGILGAFAARFPHQVIGVPVPLLIMMVFVRMRVIVGVAIYGVLETFYIIWAAAAPQAVLSNTAHFAHVGGLLAGIVLGRTLIRHQAGTSKDRPVSVDLGLLKPFARDPPTKQVLAHMQTNHDEPEVFQAWLDRFFRTATCPTCGHKVLPRPRGEIVCTQNHRFDVRKGSAAGAAAKT